MASRPTPLNERQLQLLHAVQTVLQNHLHQPTGCPTLQTVPVFDPENGQFQLLELGWDEEENRVVMPVIHCRVLNNKIWIEENRTDADLAKELMQEGVTSQEIVLGLLPMSVRQWSSSSTE